VVAIETPMRRPWSVSGDPVAAMLAAANRADPFGRLGSPREIAETVAFLMPDGAAYITGRHITVAGGSPPASCR
jgi:NAD(P)-dependent dehydrogenase (short-subunit alcohol dehydrogenase family)